MNDGTPSWASIVILLFCGGLMITLMKLGFDPDRAAIYTLLTGWVAAEIVKRLAA